MLENRFQIDIPEAEVAYIMTHLQGSKLRQQEVGFVATTNIELYKQAKKLIEEVQTKYRDLFA